MLEINPAKRFTINEVINSDWFIFRRSLLQENPLIRETTRKSLFSKLSYVMNVTTVKVKIRDLKKELGLSNY